ncbi:hypothetical protein VSR01_25030 [Actinacidiphila sp. DG2A-62]|uniref:hypothetical protein n=1 Tax=Actinacidiphila sp. DG2A-62 TaxID=3108821 RepID=UPI002DBCEEAB|nr:hypothetical protein [Actinacidiphila sp. DG2A-62]MEC3996593.1 hypothetical protein [Actinacidiphila sp. DG2A-62]
MRRRRVDLAAGALGLSGGRLDGRVLEALLEGGRVEARDAESARSAQRLAGLLTAAGAAARDTAVLDPEREEAALAEFRAAQAVRIPAPRGAAWWPRLGVRSLRVAAAALVSVLAVGGVAVAVAAGTGRLPASGGGSGTFPVSSTPPGGTAGNAPAVTGEQSPRIRPDRGVVPGSPAVPCPARTHAAAPPRDRGAPAPVVGDCAAAGPHATARDGGPTRHTGRRAGGPGHGRYAPNGRRAERPGKPVGHGGPRPAGASAAASDGKAKSKGTSKAKGNAKARGRARARTTKSAES